MREIKFRAWNTVIGRYDYFTLEDALISDNSRISKKMLNDDFTFEQFTGLTDKNGVDIYEGDIIGFGDDSPTCTDGMYGELGVVVYDEYQAKFVVNLLISNRNVTLADHLLFSDRHTCRVVYGNIHQNPELLIC